jgi:hypothetical protein
MPRAYHPVLTCACPFPCVDRSGKLPAEAAAASGKAVLLRTSPIMDMGGVASEVGTAGRTAGTVPARNERATSHGT